MNNSTRDRTHHLAAVATRLRLRWHSSTFGLLASRALERFDHSEMNALAADTLPMAAFAASVPAATLFEHLDESFHEPVQGLHVRELPIAELATHEAQALGLV